MSLFGAMFSGVTGLQAQGQTLSIISDNISNINTVGYKATVNQFSTLVTNQITDTNYSSGGVLSHPKQLIDQQGLLQSSSSPTDVAITGQGFFVVNSNVAGGTSGVDLFTRAGSFVTDLNGNLVNTGGFYLQGWPTDALGKVLPGIDTSTTQDLQTANVNVIKGSASATSQIAVGANLPAAAPNGQVENTNIVIYDSLGISHNLAWTWTKASSNNWNLNIAPPAGSAQITLKNSTGQAYAAGGRLDFNSQPADGDTVVIDGATYEFDSGGGVTAGHIAVAIGSSASITAGNLVTAVGDPRMTQGTGTNTASVLIQQTPTGPAINVDATGSTALAQNINGPFTIPALMGAQNASVVLGGQPANNDTIVVGGTTYTFKTAGPLGANQVLIGASLSASIANLVTTVGDPRLTQGKGANNNTLLIQQSSAGAALTVDPSGLTPASTPAAPFTVPVFTAPAAGVTFAGDGTPASFNVSTVDLAWTTGAQATANLALKLGTPGKGDGLTQFSDSFATNFVQQDGVPFGNFSGVSIADNGVVSALFDNGVVRPIYQLPVATFSDANALGAHTGNAYQTTTTSGNPLINMPGVGPAGKIKAGALEASTVDLATEFTNMITAQRAFSASSKVITTADQMLSDLTNIIR